MYPIASFAQVLTKAFDVAGEIAFLIGRTGSLLAFGR
jgi:hypothetical protein